MTVTATMTVEVAWSERLTGVFRIGSSLIGGTDVIAGGFGANSFDDITADVAEVRIRRGRRDDMSLVQQGVCTIRLNDATGKYNPENASSSLTGYLVPMRPVRVTATYGGTAYRRFYGYISNIEHDPDKNVKESVIEAVDFFEWLHTTKPTIATLTNQTVSYIIGQILDAVGLNSAKMRNLDSGGDTVASWSADGSRSALTLIEELLASDRGLFFIAADGRATYKTRTSLWRRASAVATLTGAEIGSLKTGVNVGSIINGQTVTRAGGTAQTHTDTTSRRKYGYRDGQSIEFAYSASDTAAMSLARFLVGLNKNPRPPARRVKLTNKDATNLTQILSREIGELVTVNESVGGTNFTGHIQAIEERIYGKVHEAWFTAQKRVMTFFTIGQSTIGSTDVIGY